MSTTKFIMASNRLPCDRLEQHPGRYRTQIRNFSRIDRHGRTYHRANEEGREEGSDAIGLERGTGYQMSRNPSQKRVVLDDASGCNENVCSLCRIV
jgi:hypothetical protein